MSERLIIDAAKESEDRKGDTWQQKQSPVSSTTSLILQNHAAIISNDAHRTTFTVQPPHSMPLHDFLTVPAVAAAALREETRGIGRLVKAGDLLGRCGVE